MSVLVIGAGPTGLTAALALAVRGMHCTIVERRTAPSELSRAVGIMPVTIDLLEPLGAAAPIVAEAMPIRQVRLMRAGKSLMQLKDLHAGNKDRVMRGLPQNRTEEILRSCLETHGVQVAYGLAAEGVASHDDNVTVRFSDGSQARYDWVIAADGVSSTTRAHLDIAYPGYELPTKWSIADVDVDGDFNHELIMLDVQAPGGTFAMALPIEKGRARLVSSTTDPLEHQVFPIQIKNVRRTAAFTISVRQASTYRAGRVLLAGDAAHCHSPLGGKGMNLGMDDAVAAVDAIERGNVDAYSTQRHQIGSNILKLTERARRTVTSQTLLAKLGVTLATKAVSTLPVARRAFLKTLMEL